MQVKPDSELEVEILACRKLVYNMCFRRLRKEPCPSALSEEITQNVLFKALRAIPTFRQGSTVPVWLYRIAFNECMSYFRSAAAAKAKRSVAIEEFVTENEEGFSFAFEPFVVNHTEETYINRIVIQRLLASLTDQNEDCS